ncbi:MAG: histidine phosphatase family protein [Candidatus Ryanbacteria bacterium]|nr:histidine phosphatase family protein [Candidatus Ryanbacteria bacterium]
MRIYLVRHGESEANRLEVKQGSDVSLSEHGKEQALFLAHRVERLPIDVVIASPYKRAKQTAEIILEHLKKPIEWRTDIVEKNHPSEVVGLSHSDPKALEVTRLWAENMTNPDWRYSDEETFSEFSARAAGFLQHLEKRSEGHILVVSHAGFIRMLLTLLVFGNNATYQQFSHLFVLFRNKNTGITVFDYTVEDGWTVQTWNDHAHLS